MNDILPVIILGVLLILILRGYALHVARRKSRMAYQSAINSQITSRPRRPRYVGLFPV
jgi:hypothetical protein